MVTKAEVEALFYETIEKHMANRKNFVSLKFNSRMRGKTLGRATLNLFNQVIEISSYHMRTNSWEDIKDTVLHEVAHVMDFHRRGTSNHDSVWQGIAVEVGAVPAASKFVTAS